MRAKTIPLLAVLAGALSLPVSARAVPPEQPDMIDDVVVTRVSDDPPAVSGILAFAVRITGRAGGEERSYFIPFMSIGQAKPVVGERCSVTWRWRSSSSNWILANGESVSSGRFVTTFRCGGNRP